MDLAAISFSSVEEWVAGGGCLVLFGLLFLCGLGLWLPEDLPLIAAGALIANHKMHWVPAAIAAWCGIIGGDIVLYHLGKKFGLEVTRLPFIGKHLTKKRIEKVEGMFMRWGVWVVAIGRLFAGIRGAMVVAAGAIRYNFLKFVIVDGIAAIISGGFFMWLGFRLGPYLAEIQRVKEWVFAGVAVLVVGAIILQTNPIGMVRLSCSQVNYEQCEGAE